MSKLAQLIGKEEGFGIPGTIPTRQNNPGDLEHAPGESHDGTGPVGSFPDPATGWARLEAQLQLFADRGMTLRQAIYTYAPPTENHSDRYLEYVCFGLGCSPDTPMADALKIQ
jgi:hypothetical protein